MTHSPARPKIYHITHGRNLTGIVREGYLWSDGEMTRRGGLCTSIGISEIKRRRLTELTLSCHPGTNVGEFVPFYFCPRSVMLFILHKGNRPGLGYKEGQRPIVHLEADLHEAVAWAESRKRHWAFTDCNAGSSYFQSFSRLSQLDQLNWEHIASDDFRDLRVKDAKQAEFLVYRSFPWSLVRSVGVLDQKIAERVRAIVSQGNYQPDVRVERTWYY
jgi:hypothetical protein